MAGPPDPPEVDTLLPAKEFQQSTTFSLAPLPAVLLSLVLVGSCSAEAGSDCPQPRTLGMPASGSSIASTIADTVATPADQSKAAPAGALSAPGQLTRPPIPPPPQVLILPARGSGSGRPPLAWRAKAYSLFKDQPAGSLPYLKASRTFAAAYDDTLAAVISACRINRLALEAVNSAAGHLLVRPLESEVARPRLILSLKEAAAGQTTVRIALDQPGPVADQHLVDSLLLTTASVLTSKGSL